MNKVLAGTEFCGYVRYVERWGFVGHGDGATPHDYEDSFRITIIVPGRDPLVGSGRTLEDAAQAARGSVEEYLKEQEGE
jgi:hypothetical protein